jgi:hypothetical protein
VVEIRRLLIHVIQSLGNHLVVSTSTKYSHDSVSKVLEKSILKKIDGIHRLCRCAISSLAERNICMSCLPFTNAVWFWWMRSGRKLMIIFGSAESTLCLVHASKIKSIVVECCYYL